MDIQEEYDKICKKARWEDRVLYGLHGRLLIVVQSSFNGSSARVRMDVGRSEYFVMNVEIHQGYCLIMVKQDGDTVVFV